MEGPQENVLGRVRRKMFYGGSTRKCFREGLQENVLERVHRKMF